MPKITEDQYAKAKALRKTWVEALRSGNYKQTRGRLHAGGGYCCLGVLCEILYGPTAWGNPTHHGFGRSDVYELIITGDRVLPPSAAADAVGLTHIAGVFNPSADFADKFPKAGEAFSLAALNDHGASFNEIADIIEAEPEAMFRKVGDEA